MIGRLRTLHVETGRHLYGGGLQVIYLAKGLMDRGHEAFLICSSHSAIEREARARGINVCPIRVITDTDPTLPMRIHSVIRRIKPDVAHLHSRRGADLFGSLAARLARVPVVIVSRRVDDRVRLDPVGRLKHIILPHRVIAISDGIRDVLLQGGVPMDKIEVVHSGVVASEFQFERDRKWFESQFGVSPETPVIGTIAQLIERKGHKYLFGAVPEILKSYPSTRFLMFGEGPVRSILEQIVFSAGIQRSVIFAGFRNDISRIIPNLDVVVHPATREGLGVSLLQTAAAGVPIIGTDAGGIPEVVRDGVTGLLIEPGNSGAIADSCIRLLRDPEFAATLGRNARRMVETEFSVEQMVDGNLRVYQEMLSSLMVARQQQEVA